MPTASTDSPGPAQLCPAAHSRRGTKGLKQTSRRLKTHRRDFSLRTEHKLWDIYQHCHFCWGLGKGQERPGSPSGHSPPGTALRPQHCPGQGQLEAPPPSSAVSGAAPTSAPWTERNKPDCSWKGASTEKSTPTPKPPLDCSGQSSAL